MMLLSGIKYHVLRLQDIVNFENRGTPKTQITTKSSTISEQPKDSMMSVSAPIVAQAVDPVSMQSTTD